jgi:ABC-2 type transport system permease protein
MTTVRICLSLLAANMRGELQYRANFLVMTLVGLALEGIGFAVIWVMLSRFGNIGGWTLGEMAYLYGFLTLTSSFTTVVFSFSPGFQWLVREGQFDRYLVRPLPPLLQLMTSRLHVPNVGPCLGGCALFIVANSLVHIDWSPLALSYMVLAIVGSCLLQAAIHLILTGLVFRLLSTGMLFYIATGLFRYGYYPLKIYPGALRFFLTFIFPIAFMGYLPATVLLNRTGEIGIPAVFAYLAPLAGIIWLAPAYWFFHRQIRYYQSAGH